MLKGSDQDTLSTRSMRKREAIIGAAAEVFLKNGYLGTNMDKIAAVSGVSKQTVYMNFGSKEALFIEIVAGMTDGTGDLVLGEEMPEPETRSGMEEYLRSYAVRQLAVVITPRIMQLRRLVIGEVGRFPELAKTLYERGPLRAMAAMEDLFIRLADRGLLVFDDPRVAAASFNWLVMADPLNRAMLLGDAAIPDKEALRHHAEEGVRVFLAAYGKG